jgi:hypothetical protein
LQTLHDKAAVVSFFFTLNSALEVVLLSAWSVIVKALHSIRVDQGENDHCREQEHAEGKEQDQCAGMRALVWQEDVGDHEEEAKDH